MDTKIVADEGLLAAVRGVTGPTYVYDKQGEAVAVVLSPAHYKDLLLSGPETRFDPALADRAWQDYLLNGGHSTTEALEMLKRLDHVLDSKP